MVNKERTSIGKSIRWQKQIQLDQCKEERPESKLEVKSEKREEEWQEKPLAHIMAGR